MLSLDILMNNIERYNYKGYDPYDILSSPLFKLPFFKSNKLIRYVFQQAGKRLPFSIRPLLLVPKGYNPVTLGLCVQAYAYLYQRENDAEKKKQYKEKVFFLVKELKLAASKGYGGMCWGYDFDWQARYATIGAYQPTVVATGIITNALFVAYQIMGLKEVVDMIISATDFVLKDLNRIYEGEIFCFSYSPHDKRPVFNASMKGARLLSQAYALSGNEVYKQEAELACEFVARHQHENGSWNYSLEKAGAWSDNYHTGYVLDCFHDYQINCKDDQFEKCIDKGYSFYKENFMEPDGKPKFYSDKAYPIDCTAAGQWILSTIRFRDIALAEKVAQYTIEKMQKKDGSFRFRKFKKYTVHTSFMRWSNAWMFAALAYLNLEQR